MSFNVVYCCTDLTFLSFTFHLMMPTECNNTHSRTCSFKKNMYESSERKQRDQQRKTTEIRVLCQTLTDRFVCNGIGIKWNFTKAFLIRVPSRKRCKNRLLNHQKYNWLNIFIAHQFTTQFYSQSSWSMHLLPKHQCQKEISNHRLYLSSKCKCTLVRSASCGKSFISNSL